MAKHDRIALDPGVMSGKPCIRGTRVPVDLVLRKLSDGTAEADLLDGYPNLTQDDIRAALVYAADSVALEEAALTAGSGDGSDA